MHISLKKHILSLILIVASISHSLAAPTELREWKSNKGTSLKAQAIFIGDQIIVLKNEAGKELSLPITSLSQADRDFLQSLKTTPTPEKELEKITPPPSETPAEPETPTEEKADDPETEEKDDTATKEDTPPTINLLPILTEGEGKGHHAFYKGDKYTASINRKGNMIVNYLDEEKNINPNWRIIINSMSFIRIDNEIARYEPIKITKHGDPKLNPEEVKLTFLKESGIITETTIQFSKKGFTTWSRSETTSKTSPDAEHMIRHVFTPTDTYPKEDLIPEKMTLEMTSMKNDKEKYNFEETEILTGNMRNFEIRGPLIGKGKIIVERSNEEKAILVLHPIPRFALKKGFSIYTFKEDHTSNDQKNEKTTFTFK